ncbi:class I SAM-dependent DNA methyltransferase [Peribacillus frigoritolerans]|uniref:class I SAM-dependent DNA methyltransferase n=1 Tax=Peribacillus frigoritolerans TaxID=450367 RepID=UPI0010593D0E|nr:class I SAM-dependent methyltransferase [Peribacillus frigoritolerans]TDL82228.1 class I SAM-dependent methyltransferase [Peribacillus frigoritolerans]
MIYKGFAEIYDELMKEAPYTLWTEFLHERMAKFGNGGTNVLDLGCGTGEISIRLKQKGYHVTGVDISEEMLSIAFQKTAAEGLSIPYFQHDMRLPSELGQLFDGIFICCDSLNYLETEEDVHAALNAAFDQLAPNGILVFDVHSIYKIHEIFNEATFADNNDEVSYIWNSFIGDAPDSIEHDLSFFVKRGSMYERFDEYHTQRTYPVNQYEEMIKQAGFTLLEITADFKNQPPESQSERIFFVAAKK